ncbi:hypothetical protein [Streptomyces sp. NPDC006510]|uniref:hypothetical protein n=1 Tax=Streptomyces sp. NPDC006510 TaxID=3155600 RepID=UPI0033BB9C8D
MHVCPPWSAPPRTPTAVTLIELTGRHTTQGIKADWRSPKQLLDFGFYGIGVVLQHPDGDLETLVEPRPWHPKRHTPDAWWFEERAYEQFLKQSPSQAPEFSPAS